MDFLVVATDAVTGQTRYFVKEDIVADHYDVFKASSSIPFFCSPYEIKSVPYYDGALGDPVPVEKAFEWGCDRVVVILAKPENILRNSRKDERLAAGIRKKYPLAAKRLCERAQRYNDEVALAQEYARQGKALIVARMI